MKANGRVEEQLHSFSASALDVENCLAPPHSQCGCSGPTSPSLVPCFSICFCSCPPPQPLTCRHGKHSRYNDSLWTRRSGDRIPMWAIFSAFVQTGPGSQFKFFFPLHGKGLRENISLVPFSHSPTTFSIKLLCFMCPLLNIITATVF